MTDSESTLTAAQQRKLVLRAKRRKLAAGDADAVADDWYNTAEKSERSRRVARDHPLIPTRTGRKKSLEDAIPHLRLHESDEDDDEGNVIHLDPFDDQDFTGWFDAIHEFAPIGGGDFEPYTETQYVQIAKAAYAWRGQLLSNSIPINCDRHVKLMDLEQRIAIGDDFGKRLGRIAWDRPTPQETEALVLGVSTRTLRRRRAAECQEQQAA